MGVAVNLAALRPLHFSPSDSDERRAALLNDLQGNLQDRKSVV